MHAAEGDSMAEIPIPVTIWITDLNDNAPVFEKDRFLGAIPESSPTGMLTLTFKENVKGTVGTDFTSFMVTFMVK